MKHVENDKRARIQLHENSVFARQSKELHSTRIYPCQHSDRLGRLVLDPVELPEGGMKKRGFKVLLLSTSLVLAAGAVYARGLGTTTLDIAGLNLQETVGTV